MSHGSYEVPSIGHKVPKRKGDKVLQQQCLDLGGHIVEHRINKGWKEAPALQRLLCLYGAPVWRFMMLAGISQNYLFKWLICDCLWKPLSSGSVFVTITCTHMPFKLTWHLHTELIFSFSFDATAAPRGSHPCPCAHRSRLSTGFHCKAPVAPCLRVSAGLLWSAYGWSHGEDQRFQQLTFPRAPLSQWQLRLRSWIPSSGGTVPQCAIHSFPQAPSKMNPYGPGDYLLINAPSPGLLISSSSSPLPHWAILRAPLEEMAWNHTFDAVSSLRKPSVGHTAYRASRSEFT